MPALGVILQLICGQTCGQICSQSIPISEWVTAPFPVARDSRTGETIPCVGHDVPKVLLRTGIGALIHGRVPQAMMLRT